MVLRVLKIDTRSGNPLKSGGKREIIAQERTDDMPRRIEEPQSTVQPKPLTIDHPMGAAPVPDDESQHVRAGEALPVVVPQHILDAEDEDIMCHLIDDGDGIVAELTGSAMHATLQNLVSHFRHVLAVARERFLPKTDDDAETDESNSGSISAAIIALIAMISYFWPTNAQAQIISQVQQQNNAQQTTVGAGNAGVLTNPSTLNVAVSPGPVYCNGGMGYIHNTQFTLTANTGPWNVFYRCSADQLAISLDNPVSSDIMIGTVTCGATLCNTLTDLRAAIKFPNVSDGIIPFGPGDCAWNTSGTAGAAATLGLLDIGASLTMVNQITATNAGASNNTLSCNIHVPQRTTASKGYMLNDCTVYYGIQQTALTSLGAPTLSTITMPTPAGGESASTVTPVSLGAVTVTPVVGSANLGTTTAGAFFSEKVALNTPVFLNTDFQTIIFQQVFAQSAAAAQSVNTPGGVCHVSVVPM